MKPTTNRTVTGNDYRKVFDAAPVSLWIEDYSGIKALLDKLRADGVSDLAAHLAAHPHLVDTAMADIHVLDVNDATVALFRANSKARLLANLDRVFRGQMREHFAAELVQMWGGDLSFETEGINYALDGTPIEILLRRCALPGFETSWERVLVSIVDITARNEAASALRASEATARGLFEHSPVSLWVEDYSELKAILDGLRGQGVVHIAQHFRENPDVVVRCMRAIRVIDVNKRTLALYRAGSKEELVGRLDDVFRDEMGTHFAEELLQMWTGALVHERESVNYRLNGEPIDIHLQWSVLPGHEAHWDRVLVSISDISARKRAEAYMKYLGTHDVLTGLANRAVFDESLQRLGAGGYAEVSVVIADLDGLKAANDVHGHAVGDALIRRAGEVLKEAVGSGDVAARIGGDEFAVLLPGTGANEVEEFIGSLRRLIDVNNQFYQGPALAMSIGAATARGGVTLLQAMKDADARMYEEKRARRR